MASTYSFDVVSDYDRGEMNNVVEQTKRELGTRYDLKGTAAAVDWTDQNKTALKVSGDNQFHLDSILDILRKKLATRGQSQKVLDTSAPPSTSNMVMSQVIALKSGLDQDKAKKITGLLREKSPKLKAQIQGDSVRVTGPKKDELQAAMQLLSAQDFDFPITYTNYR